MTESRLSQVQVAEMGFFAKSPQWNTGVYQGEMAPRARNKFGAPMFESIRPFWGNCTAFEEKTWDIVGTFRRPQ